jgi:hypothetical protein
MRDVSVWGSLCRWGVRGENDRERRVSLVWGVITESANQT